MRDFEVFVLKCPAVNGVASSSISLLEVTALQHEARNDAVELGTFVAVPSLA